MRILNPIKIIIFTIITGLMLTANTHAGDLEITMDVVKQSDAESIMECITREIELPKGDMEKVEKQHSNRSMNDVMEDNHQMRDDMNDAMEDNHQMRDDMNDAIEDSYHTRDDMNGSMR